MVHFKAAQPCTHVVVLAVACLKLVYENFSVISHLRYPEHMFPFTRFRVSHARCSTSGFNLRLFFRKMKKSEIFRKMLKTNPEKVRKEFGDDPENSGHFEGSVPELSRRILGPFR
jgi:hypothetical protein